MLRILSNPLGNAFQKSLSARGHQPLFINFFTYLLLSLLCLLFAAGISWQTLSHTFWTFSILGGLAGASGNALLVKALQKGELSVLGPINAYKSVIGVLGGILLLGELPNGWGLVGIALILYGSYFVLDTTNERFSRAVFRKREIQFRLWAMVLTAIEAVLIKKTILASSPSIAFVSWCWFGAVFSLALVFIFRLPLWPEWKKATATNNWRFAMLVLCIGVMQWTTNYVLDHMPVGSALSLFQLSVLVSVLLGYRLFQEGSVRRKLVGSAIMLAGSVLIILMKS